MPNKEIDPTATMMIVVDEVDPSTDPKTYQYVYVGNINDLPSDVLTEGSIVNDLSTGGTDKPLSAEQGRTLNSHVNYTTCGSGAGDQVKLISDDGFELSTHLRLLVKMTNTNTHETPKLNINNTGAITVWYNGAVASGTNTWSAGEVLDVYYDGTEYIANPHLNVDDEPTAESENLVNSGGVYSGIRSIVDSYNISSNIDFELSDENGNSLVRFQNGHIKTKNFDSTKDAATSVENNISDSDLDLSDENGNVLVRFKNGGIKTKNFDSNTAALIHNLSYKRRAFWQQTVDTTNYLVTCYDDVNINSYEIITYYNDNVLLYLPSSYKKDGEPTKLIIYCKHGDSKIEPDSDDILSSNNLGKIFRFMLHLGYGILAADGTPNEWASQLGLLERPCGSYVAVESTIRAFDYVKNHYNIDADNVFIFGYSQGGLYSQNVIDNSNIPIAAAAQVSPVVSMRYQQWDNIGNVTPTFQWTYPSRYNIAKIFNFPSFTTDEELSQLEYDYNKTVGYDPWLRNVDNMYDGFIQGTLYGSNLWGLPSGTSIDGIAMKKHIKCPLKIWASKNDSVIGSDVWKVFVKAIKNSGQIADLQLYSTGAHIPIYSQNQVLGTFTENEDICNLYPMALDIASWYFRFGGYPIDYQV